MQGSEDRLSDAQHVARELARLDIDIAALSEARFAEQGSLTEDGAGYTILYGLENTRPSAASLVSVSCQNFHGQKTAELDSDRLMS